MFIIVQIINVNRELFKMSILISFYWWGGQHLNGFTDWLKIQFVCYLNLDITSKWPLYVYGNKFIFRISFVSDHPSEQFKTIVSSSHIHILVNGSLNFRSVEASDAGRYLCEANNGVGTGLSAVVQLRVHSKYKLRIWRNNFNLNNMFLRNLLASNAEESGSVIKQYNSCLWM